jgi:hypothetical protein
MTEEKDFEAIDDNYENFLQGLRVWQDFRHCHPIKVIGVDVPDEIQSMMSEVASLTDSGNP